LLAVVIAGRNSFKMPRPWHNQFRGVRIRRLILGSPAIRKREPTGNCWPSDQIRPYVLPDSLLSHCTQSSTRADRILKDKGATSQARGPLGCLWRTQRSKAGETRRAARYVGGTELTHCGIGNAAARIIRPSHFVLRSYYSSSARHSANPHSVGVATAVRAGGPLPPRRPKARQYPQIVGFRRGPR
jgi:hypothetical protein